MFIEILRKSKIHILLLVFLTGCASSSLSSANSSEQIICSDIKKITENLSSVNGDIFSIDPTEINYQIKILGLNWISSSDELLKLSLKDISDFNLGSAISPDKPSFVPGAATFDLVLKLFTANNVCSNFSNTDNEEVPEEIINKLFTNDAKKEFG